MLEPQEGCKEVYIPHLKKALGWHDKMELIRSYSSPDPKCAHLWDRIMLCPKGKYRCAISQKGKIIDIELKPGQVLFCPKNGAFVNGENKDYILMTIIFWDSLVRYLLKLPGKGNIWMHTLNPVNAAGQSVLEALRELVKTEEPGEKDSLLMRTLLILMQEKLESEEIDESCKSLKTYQLIQEYIYSNFHLPINRKSAAEKLKITPQHISRLYKQFSNDGFNTELKKIRMARAKELLRYSPMLLDEISEQCGFANTGYFIKSFKKACRVSPGAFRNKHSVSNLKK